MNGIGAPINRTDAWAKVSGAAHYTAEHHIENLAQAVLVTSTIPSAACCASTTARRRRCLACCW